MIKIALKRENQVYEFEKKNIHTLFDRKSTTNYWIDRNSFGLMLPDERKGTEEITQEIILEGAIDMLEKEINERGNFDLILPRSKNSESSGNLRFFCFFGRDEESEKFSFTVRIRNGSKFFFLIFELVED